MVVPVAPSHPQTGDGETFPNPGHQTVLWGWSLAEGAHRALLGQELKHNPLCSREENALGQATPQQCMEGDVVWFPCSE